MVNSGYLDDVKMLRKYDCREVQEFTHHANEHYHLFLILNIIAPSLSKY